MGAKKGDALDHTFTGEINADGVWHAVEMPGSKEILGTGRAVKVIAEVDGVEVATSFMPTGQGGHMFPIKESLRTQLGKGAGDTVTIRLLRRG